MANYTAADVKRLRELTGSGMMACKNALADADGDFDKAVEQLRIKGAKDVGKRAERTTAEGLVVAKDGVMIEINCETDFVAKNDEFIKLADSIVTVAAAGKPADLDALKALELDGKTIDTVIQEQSAKIGEKLELSRVASFDGPVAVYLHKRSADLPPAVGVLVEYTGEGDAAAEAARAAAMQVAALKAKYVTRDEVPAEIVASERHIAEETARAEGKPEQALPKIIEGRVNGYFKDVVLTEQSSVQDSKKTVKAILDEAGVTIKRFVRFEVGASA
ncbi:MULTISPECIES: translation elongation factor Ts [Rhodococcus]|uniref:translation elongation factor Ts n=1 Tax=Rhodococcus TaxID=1827 RepID=UPI001E32BB27|nr:MULTISPECIES: translation elongation factor Ts [Rhodococcus]MCD2104191.1 translation elongation factor Ts [Rhodococcus qingshengii]MCZ4523244.1 translation elongation factor Ts [Rhodococcus erythropolis]MDV8007148.1 translation elongation factor Ts [Rhodococcus sp. IEGM 1318]